MMQTSPQAAKLVSLYTEAAPEGRPQMFQDALTAAIRWAGPDTSEAELTEFIQRQVMLLEGADMLSTMVRAGWEALAQELGIPAHPADVISLVDQAEIREQMAGTRPRKMLRRRTVAAA